MTDLDQVDGLVAAQLTHQRISSLEATATVGELRDYFAASESRRLAVLVDGDRYVGSIERDGIPDGTDEAQPAIGIARVGPVADAHLPGGAARDAALDEPTGRLPVVDGDGNLVGVIAIDRKKNRFCGT